MRHFPLFLDTRGKRIVVSGAGDVAVAKLRLLLKTEASILVAGEDPVSQIRAWAEAGRLTLVERQLMARDVEGAALVYGANDHGEWEKDARAAALGREAGARVNLVDDLNGSDFITPAVVDRDPVTVAIGTEGAAPVLARRIKSDVEENLPATLGTLARAGHKFRGRAEALPYGAIRRRFWAPYYDEIGPRVLAEGGEESLPDALEALLSDMLLEKHAPGHVSILGAGPGDPDLLTLKARKCLHDADVVIYDRLVSAEIIELARREATLVEVGKVPGGTSWSQEDINALLVEHARDGVKVVRLKSGDPGVYGRLDEEMDALDAAGITFDIVPGITSAAAAAAVTKVSLTQRGRNSALRILTGHDTDGFAEHDWRGLAEPGSVAAIYMGVRAARFLQGRLMIHGADAATPVTAVENISRPSQKIVTTTLGALPQTLADNGIAGPAIIFLGLAQRGFMIAMETGDATTREAVATGGL
ncbi:MAG: siroheme synthase CysG [Hyphomicrobiaceae bacterium]